MKLVRLLSSMALAAAAVVAIAGCGGDEGAETTPRPLTKAVLIEKGDAICAEVNAALAALGAEAAQAEIADTIERSADLFLGLIERLQGLGTRPEDDSGYTKFLAASERFAEVERQVKAAAESEDTLALSEAAAKAAAALKEFRSQAAAYGFKQCSKDAGATG